MSDSESGQLAVCATVLQLEWEARHATGVTELGFFMVNRIFPLLPAATVVFWDGRANGRGRVQRVSGVAEIDANAPFIQWVGRVAPVLAVRGETRPFAPADLDANASEDWSCQAPPHALWIGLVPPGGVLSGGVLLFRETPWQPREVALASRLGETFAHARLALGDRHSPRERKSWRKWPVAVLLLALPFWVSIPQSVLAPATVIAKDPLVVTSPMDGVIEKVEVVPNGEVQEGQVLFRMEQTAIRNRWQVAEKTLKVAEAEVLKARQMSFANTEIKSTLPLLQARVEQRAAETHYAAQRLDRTVVRAGRKGIAIFGDAGEWRGKPVLVGERVMIIAHRDQAELDIRLPLDDAVIFARGAKVRLFLNTDPLRPIIAVLEHAGYDATPTPEGFLAYRLKARFPEGVLPPRIGLRGMAKIFGPPVSLFYYLFRRPLTAMRQSVGF